MFAEFTELFSVHCCMGRQKFTSMILPLPKSLELIPAAALTLQSVVFLTIANTTNKIAISAT
jgi:hypothetical protein